MNYSRSIPTYRTKIGSKNLMGRMLQALGKLTREEVEQVLRLQEEKGMRFGEAARYLSLVTEEDVQQALACQFDYPYLRRGVNEFPVELAAGYWPFSPEVETLRKVRSQLLLHWFDTGRKSLVVMCVDPGGGASFFNANLAVAFSQLGKQTLLVDANLRRPRQHQIFNIHSRQGLSDLLVGRGGAEELESKIDAFPYLSVLPAGTIAPNPQELISHDAFRMALDAMSCRFDVVLVDVPAYTTAADALVVAARVGGVLLVVRKDKTRLADIAAINTQLARNSVQVVGSVLIDF